MVILLLNKNCRLQQGISSLAPHTRTRPPLGILHLNSATELLHLGRRGRDLREFVPSLPPGRAALMADWRDLQAQLCTCSSWLFPFPQSFTSLSKNLSVSRTKVPINHLFLLQLLFLGVLITHSQ